MSKHTPGPWKVDDLDDADVFSADGCNIATAWTFGHGDGEIRAANARLITAAPTMLEALKLLVKADCGLRANQSAFPHLAADMQRIHDAYPCPQCAGIAAIKLAEGE